MTGLLTVAQARAAVIAFAAPALECEPVAVADALGRVLAEDVRAHHDVPPFPNSAMDGYAVLAGPPGRELRIVDESRAGAPATRAVRAGEAIRISTGAPVPAGATSIVPVEQASENGEAVRLDGEARPHGNIRDAGEDL